MDTFSECSEFKKNTLKSKLDFNQSSFNMVSLIPQILSSSMMKIKPQDSCSPIKVTMSGSETTEETNTQEITPLSTLTKIPNSGNSLSNTWLTTIFPPFSSLSI
jgi:hypothetical protein